MPTLTEDVAPMGRSTDAPFILARHQHDSIIAFAKALGLSDEAADQHVSYFNGYPVAVQTWLAVRERTP